MGKYQKGKYRLSVAGDKELQNKPCIVMDEDGNVVLGGAPVDDTGTTASDTVWSSQKVSTELATKQDTLVSGTNIKTVDGQSILGSGNLVTDKRFKGWFTDLAALQAKVASPEVGDYAYVADASPATTTSIYVCETAATWTDSGRDVDTSNVQTFQTGEQVNEVGIDATPTANSTCLVESGGVYNTIHPIDVTVNGDNSAWANANRLDYFQNSNGVWGTSSSKTYRIAIFEVQAGDVIDVTWQGTTSNTKGYRYIVADYPTYHGEVGNTLDAQYNSEISEQITSGINGYFIVGEYYANLNHSPVSLKINNIDMMASTEGLVDVVAGIESNVEDMQAQLDNVEGAMSPFSMQSHQDMFSLESDWWMEEKWLEDKFADTESTVVTALVNKVQQRAGSGKYQIAVISDTHGSGAYSWKSINEVNRKQSTCYRSIAVFNKLRSICNAALHGGDLSCDYGTSRLRDLQYMYAIIRKIKAYPNLVNEQTKPLFITKGNHDENNNAYIEVADRINIDWVNNTYYVRNFSTFTQVTESTWDGSPLYVASTELVSDKEFRNVVQHWMSPSGAVWGSGAYYYYDIEDYKIRFVVANSFPVNDNHVVSEDEEYLWFAQTALNLSSKSNPQEWQVIVLRHTQATSIASLSDCINAFQNGTTWTYGETTVDFGNVNGGGCTFIAHVHGHEHMNCVSNAKDFFDIGENIGCTNLNDLGDATKYGLSVLTIDTANKIITEDAIDGSTWQYDYANNKILMNVGDTITAARSGLSSPTPTSSDTNVVTCNGMVITAVGSGDADVTLSQSIIYHVRVLSA